MNDDEYLAMVTGQRVSEWVKQTGLPRQTAYDLKDRLVLGGKVIVRDKRLQLLPSRSA